MLKIKAADKMVQVMAALGIDNVYDYQVIP